ncbi:MAG: DUF3488 and transglutaminase-like domain-containing protein [Amphritea sp.]|nr:DUF3488 and transglutaminase-like domain-containing protein [Amphritea sp.]
MIKAFRQPATDTLNSPLLAVGALLLFSLIPALGELHAGIALIALLPFVLRPLLLRRRVIRWLAIGSGLAGTAGLLWSSGTEWLSGETLLSGLAVILMMKWLEADSKREFLLLSYGALLLTALSSLYLSGLSAFVYLVLATLMLLNALLTIVHQKQSVLPRLMVVGKVFLLGLPLSAMLFVTAPRIQGPLWDLGIVMGLPIELVIDQEEREKGIKGSLRAGQVTRLKQSDAPVLVAEFKGVVPYKSRLYWRGAVFSHYDGVEWQLPEGWNNRSRLLSKAYKKRGEVESLLTSKKDLVSYEARVTPHGERWLYALDLPVGRSVESFISSEFQMLGIRKVSQEFNYEQKAYLEYTGGAPMSDDERSSYLELPANSNSRLINWGRQLTGDPIHQLRVHLAEGGYQVTATPDIAEYEDSLDEFFFDRKEGGIEHLASATAIALRAAGVPTRLVSGYRGGNLIALTNFIVVRQGNAHVWVEAWLDGTGWQRVEALDFVSPPKKENRPQPAAQAAPKPESKKQTPELAESPKEPVEQAVQVTKTPEQKRSQRRKTGPGWLQQLSAGLETWVLNYNPDRQVELMQKSGLRKVDWKTLMALTIAGLLLMIVIYSAFLKLKRRRQDPVDRAFNQLNQRLAKLDCECRFDECPQTWLLRLQEKNLPFYGALEHIIQQYLQLRYGAALAEGDTAVKDLQRDVKRLIAML